MSRPTAALTIVSLSALALVACNPRLPASQDAPDPDARAEAPPLNVDVVDRPDEPVEGAPPPPTEAPPVLTEASNPDPTPPARPTPPVRPEPEEEPEPDFEPEEPDEPRFTHVGDTHCLADERPVYSCPFGDGRVVSVCAGPQEVAYRFGLLGDPELELLRDPAGEGVRYSVDRRRGEGRQSQIRFENGNYDYIVYSSQEGRRGSGGRGRRAGESGVVVLRNGEEINHLECPTASRQTALRVALIRDDVPRERRSDGWW